jgi:hypothetical protein
LLPALDDLDSDHAAYGAGGGYGRGQEPVGGFVAQDRDPDQDTEGDEADPVAEAEDEGLVLEARQQPEREQGGEQGQLDVGRELDPAEERARGGFAQRRP